VVNKTEVMFLLVLFCSPVYAGWFSSDGSNFEECMENRRTDIKNSQQLGVASRYCSSKHPSASTPTTTYTQHEVLAVDSNNTRLQNYTSNLNITALNIKHDGHDYGSGIKSDDFKYYQELVVTNRNDFPISGLIIGLHKVKKAGLCSWDDKDYREIYSCEGTALAKQSGVYKCYIADAYKNKFPICVVGFNVYATDADFKSVILGQ
jgi:hypothetical protein